jgi:hypothetical protein
MTNPYRAMCSDLIDALDAGIPAGRIRMSPLADRARALLAQPVAEGPSDEEARELADDLGITRGFFDHECGLHISCADLEPFARAVLARWGRPTPQPVPVSERLPGPEDCLDEGWTWFFNQRIGWRQAVLPVSTGYTHWLPANALPTPEATND